jgi:hypothetical protein
MKHALALLLLSCVLVAQDKPNSDDPGEILRRAALGLESPAPSGKPAVTAPKPAAVEKAAVTKPEIPPINVIDELIELIHQLKKDATVLITPPSDPDDFGGTNGKIRADIYTARIKAKTDAQNALLQALVELAKLPAESPTAYHSLSPPGARNPRRIPPTPSK